MCSSDLLLAFGCDICLGSAWMSRVLEGTKEGFYPNIAEQGNSSYKQILTIIFHSNQRVFLKQLVLSYTLDSMINTLIVFRVSQLIFSHGGLLLSCYLHPV